MRSVPSRERSDRRASDGAHGHNAGSKDLGQRVESIRIDETNGSFATGEAMIGNVANYRSLAEILTSFVTMMAAKGVTIHALSPQNEPDMSKAYRSATRTPGQIHDFVPDLHAAFQVAGVTGARS